MTPNEKFIEKRAKDILWQHVLFIEDGERLKYGMSMAVVIHRYKQMLKKRDGVQDAA